MATKEKKTAVLKLRIPPSLQRRIAAAARLDQREVADWLRLAISNATEKQK